MSKKNRAISAVLALTIVFSILFSVCFIVAEADHTCVGEDCPICFQISLCENTLKSIGFAVATIVFFVFPCSRVFSFLTITEKLLRTVSLVSLKVKLSD